VDPIQQTLEVERIVNLVRGFGWEKKAELVNGDRLQLTIEKQVAPKAGPETPLG